MTVITSRIEGRYYGHECVNLFAKGGSSSVRVCVCALTQRETERGGGRGGRQGGRSVCVVGAEKVGLTEYLRARCLAKRFL